MIHLIHFVAAIRELKSFGSSSEDEDEQRVRLRRASKDFDSSDSDASEKQSPKSRLLRQMERELAKEKLSGSDSDELVPIRSSMGGAGTLGSDFSYVYFVFTMFSSSQILFFSTNFR